MPNDLTSASTAGAAKQSKESAEVQAEVESLLEFYNRYGVEINYEQALDEATANYAGNMIRNTDVLSDFIRRYSEDRTLLEKLRDAIRELVQKLTGRAKQQAQTAEGMLQEAFEAASRQATENSKNAANEGGETKFSLKAFGDGTRFVDVQTEQEQFDGLSDAQKRKKATQIINIEPVAKGLRLKDVTKIENITQDLYSSYGANPKSVFLRDASMDSIDSGSDNVKGKFSLKTDSKGRQLTEAQEEYFKDSKVRDMDSPSLCGQYKKAFV